MKNQRHQTSGITGGRRTQSGLAQDRATGQGAHHMRAGGMIVRGAVVNTYVQRGATSGIAPVLNYSDVTAVYCDVLAYGSTEGFRNAPLPRVLVMQHMGMHDGHIWIPRETTLSAADEEMKLDTIAPEDMDGDHVLIQFLEDDLGKPIITGRIPHPRLGQGNEGLTQLGHRMKAQASDLGAAGTPEFWKRNGTFFGVDKDGNYVLDTTRAHGGEFATDGAEVPKDNAANGNVTVRANAKTTVKVVGTDTSGANPKFELTIKDNEMNVKLQDGQTFKLVGKDGTSVLTLGDGVKHTAVFEYLQAFWDNVMLPKFAAFDAHVHATGVGPSGPPAPLMAVSALPANVKSTKVSFPDG